MSETSAAFNNSAASFLNLSKIVSQAINVARPFKSAAAEAAVGEVFAIRKVFVV